MEYLYIVLQKIVGFTKYDMEHYQKEDYEVWENNIRRICEGMGIPVSEVMEFENKERVNLRQREVPVVVKYRKLDKFDQCRV